MMSCTYEKALETARNNINYLSQVGNLSMTSLAEIAGISVSYLSRLMSGAHAPSLKTIWSICNVFSVSLNEMCTTDMRKKSEQRAELLHEGVEVADDDDALALTLFQNLPSYDRDTILRLLQSMVGASAKAEEDFNELVLPMNGNSAEDEE